MSSSAYVWHFEAFYRHLPFLLAGVRYTVLVSVLAILFGLVVGLSGTGDTLHLAKAALSEVYERFRDRQK